MFADLLVKEIEFAYFILSSKSVYPFFIFVFGFLAINVNEWKLEEVRDTQENFHLFMTFLILVSCQLNNHWI